MHVWLNKCSIGEKKRRLSKIVKYCKLLTSRVNKCWNTQTQVFGFRNRFSKLQKLKFHIKQVNYYLRWTILTCRLASLPEKPATIDWSHYRSVVAKAGMVDEFEKKVRSSGGSVSQFITVLRVLYASVSQSTVRCIDGPWASGHSDS